MAKAKPPSVVVVDFETEPIKPRPHYPPKPVGVSIKWPGKPAAYFAFGHRTKNNCTVTDAKRALAAAWKSGMPLLFHNGKFDVDVAEVHMGMKLPPWSMIHDSMFLLFLHDPHAPDLKLKPAAERVLGMKPEERDALREWAIANKIMPKSRKEAGEFIWMMPGDLVGRYANGDVIRTERLYLKLWPLIHSRDMLEAYDRERQLMPILLANERVGIMAMLPELRRDCAILRRGMDQVDGWLRKKLKAKDLNIDSDKEFAQALISAGVADEGKFRWTEPSKTHPEGQLSTSKDSLLGAVTDRRVMNVLQYRSMLQTRLGTFLEPWMREAEETGGVVHPAWNQVRQSDGGSGLKGSRTGRLSASRFMNAPAFVGTSQHDSVATVNYRHPDYIKDLPQLPAVRMYLRADKGQRWCKRDYAQQELRILAHYEDSVLLNSYRENPRQDMHQLATDLVEKTYGIVVGRTRMKTIGFSILYGMGVGELASRLGMTVQDAKTAKDAYLKIFPGLPDLIKDLKSRGQQGLPLRTWGGREYFCEAPKFVKKRGRVVTFEYKLINYLIQGSAADCTKQALINYDAVKKDGRFILTVHDEISMTCAPGAVKSEMKILRAAMADMEFDVPMLSDGKTGIIWGDLKAYKED